MHLPTFIPRTEAGLLPCAGQPELYDTPDTQPEAAALCARCPVRQACDTWAVDHAEWGTWAGRTDQDRGTPREELPDLRRIPVNPALPCGTEQARRRHIGQQEQCPVCDQAYAGRLRDERLAALTAQHRRPGGPTRTGYRLHLLLDIPSCGPCRAAQAASLREHRGRAALAA
ncbi:WhiB family transcriptional regulator [Kitasatospora sp. NPDC127116]|uniref:WhiB family transcriptional regulator n=1 Tax=Kitasatospora sp. NPDC127116 TaxID=3345367 RepID=UPI00363E328A